MKKEYEKPSMSFVSFGLTEEIMNPTGLTEGGELPPEIGASEGYEEW